MCEKAALSIRALDNSASLIELFKWRIEVEMVAKAEKREREPAEEETRNWIDDIKVSG